MIEKLFSWYRENQSELVKQYDGKYIVITDDGVKGAFDSENDGYDYAVKTFGRGNFMLQKCSEGEKDYSIHFYTYRVAY